MRRPRMGLVISHSGGVGAPPGRPLRAARQELADDPGKSGRKRGPTPEEERRGEAPRGAPASVIRRRSLPLKGSARPQGGPRGAAFRTSALRRFTPLDFRGEQECEGEPPHPSKNGRRSVGCLTIKQDGTELAARVRASRSARRPTDGLTRRGRRRLCGPQGIRRCGPLQDAEPLGIERGRLQRRRLGEVA